jgi:hypothetical protein
MSKVLWRLYNAATQEQLVDLDLTAARALLSRIPHPQRHSWFAWKAGWPDWVKLEDAAELQLEVAPPPPPPPPAPSAMPTPILTLRVEEPEETQSVDPRTSEALAPGLASAPIPTTATPSLTQAPVLAAPAPTPTRPPAPVRRPGPSSPPTLANPIANAGVSLNNSTQAPTAPPTVALEVQKPITGNHRLAVATTPAPAPQPAAPAAEVPEVDRRKHVRHRAKLKAIIEMNGRTFRTFTKDVSLGGLLLQDVLPWPVTNEACKVYLASPDGKESIEFRSRIVVDLKNPKRIAFDDASAEFTGKLEAWIAALLSGHAKAA